MRILAIIPARGGSRGIPNKNIKALASRPLIAYSIDVAREIVSDEDICLSTDSNEIAAVASRCGLAVPFIRPAALAGDSSGTVGVLLHALDFYRQQGKEYDVILLLQPTSPFRTAEHVRQALALFNATTDMVVSVKASSSASVLCLEDEHGYVHNVFNASHSPRQECASFWEYNGAIYVISVPKLLSARSLAFDHIVKYEMPVESSLDLDTMLDWSIAEMVISGGVR
ncbi:MAG: acylneuraminate cytidylyltransferase family protein [Mucinivorans sp.]